MNIKLKLQIELTNHINNREVYFGLKLKFLDKDDRFEYDFNDENEEKYSAINGMDIITDRIHFLGSIVSNDKFYVPHLDKIGLELTKNFKYDKNRYLYLKNLYESLHEWANMWYGFNNDNDSIIEIIGDKWIVGNL